MILRVPTNRSVAGPKLSAEKDKLIVSYDFEEDDGRLTQGQMTFEMVLSFEYKDNSCCIADDVISGAEIRILDRSEYLERILNLWDKSVGWQAWQLEKGGRSRFKHFTIYFDDAACLNLIAASCRED